MRAASGAPLVILDLPWGTQSLAQLREIADGIDRGLVGLSRTQQAEVVRRLADALERKPLPPTLQELLTRGRSN